MWRELRQKAVTLADILSLKAERSLPFFPTPDSAVLSFALLRRTVIFYYTIPMYL
jgi:hypothetical protein